MRLPKIEACGAAEAAQIHQQLQAYNSRFLTDYEEYAFCIRDAAGALIAGITAQRDLDCVRVGRLFMLRRATGFAQRSNPVLAPMDNIFLIKSCLPQQQAPWQRRKERKNGKDDLRPAGRAMV